MSLTRSNVGEKEMKAEFFLPDDYRPAEDEPFMNERQLEYFRRKLITLARGIAGRQSRHDRRASREYSQHS